MTNQERLFIPTENTAQEMGLVVVNEITQRNTHHFLHEEGKMPRWTRDHSLLQVRMDKSVHDEYHNEYHGINRHMHKGIFHVIRTMVDTFRLERRNMQPWEVVGELAWTMDSIARNGEARHRKDARLTEQLLTPQMDFLIRGGARYGEEL